MIALEARVREESEAILCYRDRALAGDHALLRRAIVDEAYTWLRTPFHHGAGIKGVGCDCLMLLIRCYQASGIFPKDFKGGAYAQHWHMHRNEEVYLGGVELLCHRIETPGLGDIVMFRYGRTVSHGGICIEDGKMIHATAAENHVSMDFVSQHSNYIYGFFSVFP